MSLTRIGHSVLATLAMLTALLVVAPTAHADCEYQGSRRAGGINCVAWSADQIQGSTQTTGSATAGNSDAATSTGQVSVAGTGTRSGGTSSAPTCRDGRGQVVPCTTENPNGGQCFFGEAIAPSPTGQGSGAVYLCPPEPTPADDDEAGSAAGAATSPGAPAVDPVIVVWQAVASMDLHAVDVQVAPAPLSADADSMGLVGLPVWLWIEPTASTWGPITASASDGPVSVSVTARVDRVEWDMGDGTVITCTSPGTPFYPDVHGVEDRSPDCGHIYERVPRDPSGAYTLSATSYWVAEWSSGGESGTIPFDFTTTEQIRIGELQVLRTAGHS